MNDEVTPTGNHRAGDRLDVDSLVGLTVPQTWKLVKASGGHLRRVVEGAGLAQGFDRSPGRVTVLIKDNRVVRVISRN